MTKICFLTSKLMDLQDENNEFAVQLKEVWPKNGAKLLIVASYPDSYDKTDEVAEEFECNFSKAGLSVRQRLVLDNRNADKTEKLLEEYDVIILMGGYVPLQNEFFKKIQLRDEIQNYSGIVIGISAGSMNSADIVYVQPEYDEDVRENFIKFEKGLNLTKVQIIPHYQKIKDDVLKGKRLFEDITYADSQGNEFYALIDGSFLRVENKKNELFGEAYRIKDGNIKKICENGRSLLL